MKFRSRVIDKRQISDDTIVLVLEKGTIQFTAGQYIVLSFPDEKEAREYSVYNGEHEDTIEILVKALPEGSFSVRLSDLNIDNPIYIDGPFGYFIMKPDEVSSKKHVFIASGTGISPFRSYINTYPKLNYKLLHGLRFNKDIIEPENYAPSNLQLCISREETNYFKGRVTNFLSENELDQQAIYHLCGNSEMINDVSDYLEDHNIAPTNIRTEVFF